MNNKPGIFVYMGMGILTAIWIWLAWVIIASNGLTLYNLLLIGMTGIIIFVPLYKKYFSAASSRKGTDPKDKR